MLENFGGQWTSYNAWGWPGSVRNMYPKRVLKDRANPKAKITTFSSQPMVSCNFYCPLRVINFFVDLVFVDCIVLDKDTTQYSSCKLHVIHGIQGRLWWFYVCWSCFSLAFFIFRLESVVCKKYTNANGKDSKHTNAIDISIIWSCDMGRGRRCRVTYRGRGRRCRPIRRGRCRQLVIF